MRDLVFLFLRNLKPLEPQCIKRADIKERLEELTGTTVRTVAVESALAADGQQVPPKAHAACHTFFGARYALEMFTIMAIMKKDCAAFQLVAPHES